MNDSAAHPAALARAHVRQVEAMAGYGIPLVSIALVLDLSEADLEREYGTELKAGAVKANAKVAENLFRRATGEGREAVVAAIFWLKVRAGWKETSQFQIGGPDGRPIRVVISAEDAGVL